MTDQDPDISGKIARLRPGHYAAIGGVCVAALLLTPALTALINHQHRKEASQAQLQVGGLGTPWHPPVIPVTASVPLTPPPAPSAAPLPLPSRTTLALLPGRDPEQAALTSPIRMAGSPQRVAETRPAGSATPGGDPPVGTSGELSARLQPTVLSGYRASRLADPAMTIEQGRIIQCIDVTAIDSSLPGFVKATIPQDVWSADGSNILINRGSTVFGEIAHGLANGQERLFVLWRQVMTPAPNFVRITLNSPAADELGENGLGGDVNHHMWRKIGGALLLSGIDAAFQGASSGLSGLLSGRSGTGSTNLNFYQFQGEGQSLASQLLASTISIPDTLHRDQAQPCSIFVSGDLSFADVYRDRVTQ
jgi:type IV secretion system protein VirB10